MNYTITKHTNALHTIDITTTDGAKAVLTNAGASIVELWVPDKNGELGNVVLGYQDVEHYLNNTMVFGATIGRHAGRIDRAKIEVGGQMIQLPTNENDNLLHGGDGHFGTSIWQYTVEEVENAIAVRFTIASPDGANQFPGHVIATVTMTFAEDHSLRLDYDATTDAETVLNLTNHSYFNLSGHLSTQIDDHTLELHSDYYLQLADDSIPTYAKAVRNTDFDYNQEKLLAHIFTSEDAQATLVNGFDHPFHLIGAAPQIRLTEPHVGRMLEVETDYPVAVVYTGNSIDESVTLTNGEQAKKHSAICFETQLEPYSMRYQRTASTLQPNERYQYYTIFKFSTIEK